MVRFLRVKTFIRPGIPRDISEAYIVYKNIKYTVWEITKITNWAGDEFNYTVWMGRNGKDYRFLNGEKFFVEEETLKNNNVGSGLFFDNGSAGEFDGTFMLTTKVTTYEIGCGKDSGLKEF